MYDLEVEDEHEYYAEEVLVHNCHRISSIQMKKDKNGIPKQGQYLKVLSNLAAIHRFGFTATLPYLEGAKIALEGLIGPVIGELSITEAAELQILAKPEIKLFRTERIPELENLRNYKEAYRRGIVQNYSRNHKILSLAAKLIEKNKTSLIIVNYVQHGEILQEMSEEQFRHKIEFVHGAVDNETRQDIKTRLIAKEIPAAICTSAWIEGIDLPSLGAVINAGGGKSEIRTIQAIGRGLRKTSEKDTVIIIDFFDPSSKYFIDHFGYRLSLYFEQGWMGEDINL